MGIVSEFFKVDSELADLLMQANFEREESEDGLPSEDTQELLMERAKNREEFLSDLGCWYMRVSSHLEARKAEYQPILDRIKSDLKTLQNELDFITWVFDQVFPKRIDSELANERIYLYRRKSERVEILDDDKIPIDYVELIPSPRKTLIKEALKRGKPVPGAALVEDYSLQVKPGGDTAVKKLKARQKRRAREEEKKAKEATEHLRPVSLDDDYVPY